MAAINVLRKVKVDGKWQLLPVSKTGGKLDFRFVVHRGVNVVSVEGTFYLEWREGGKRIRRAVGTHPREARAAQAYQLSVLNLRRDGGEVEDAPQIQSRVAPSGPSIAQAIAGFVASPPVGYRQRSIWKYNNALDSFQKWTLKTHLSQLDRTDLIGFMSHMVKAQGLEVSTAVDKAHIVHFVLNDRGAEIKMKKGDWPRYTEKTRDAYEPVDLKPLFAACDARELVLFQTFLLTGFRDQEVGFLSWDDFNPRAGTLRVSKKKELGFDPKNYQERTNPIPQLLIDLLNRHRKTLAEDEYLMFPTSRHNRQKGLPGGQRDRHMLELLKRVAFRAGLNCGRCTGTWRTKKNLSCKDSPICERFGLHIFRHTYATTLLQDGVDIVSLQTLLGHADLESTRKDHRALSPDRMREKINSTSLATKFYEP